MSTADKKEKKIVYFDVTKLETMKRKQMQSLAKRAGLSANPPNDELRASLKEYYNANQSAIKKLGEELKTKRKAKPKRKITDELQSTLNWGKKTNID